VVTIHGEAVVECVAMSGQLARNSVKTYRFAPEGFETVRKRLTLIQNITFVGVLGLIIGIDFKDGDQDWLRGSLLSLLPHVFAFTFVGAFLIYSFRRAIEKQRENWLAYELVVGEDFVIRRMPGLSEMKIRRDEVTAIRQNAQGLSLETSSRQQTLGVPSTLEEFEEVRAQLSEWMPPTEVRRATWKHSLNLVYWVIAVELGLFLVFFLSTKSWLAVSSGATLFGGLIWSLISVERSVQLAPKMKRTMWIILLPLMAIGFRILEAIRNWR
jgi:hypothetical protein